MRKKKWRKHLSKWKNWLCFQEIWGKRKPRFGKGKHGFLVWANFFMFPGGGQPFLDKNKSCSSSIPRRNLVFSIITRNGNSCQNLLNDQKSPKKELFKWRSYVKSLVEKSRWLQVQRLLPARLIRGDIPGINACLYLKGIKIAPSVYKYFSNSSIEFELEFIQICLK